MVAVYYSIRKGLAQRHFDLDFPSVYLPELRKEAHELSNKPRDGLDATRERLLQFNERRNEPLLAGVISHLANKLF
jgi:hypothetical protein